MSFSDKENIAKIKSKQFAIRIVRLYTYLHCEKKEFVMSKQLLRAGTSIGANISESECAASDKDFLNKIYIALKESNETLYWLELLYDTDFLSQKQFDSIYSDCLELTKILTATTKTMKTKLEQK